MGSISQLVVPVFLFYSLAAFAWGVKNRKNPFGLSKLFGLTGSFVWIDSIVFGSFFTSVSIYTLLTEQWIIFWLIFSVFWLIRSFGETLYWFLEQFATRHRNPPKNLWAYRLFKGEEVWVFMQIYWQCISVIALIATVYFFSRWLN